MNTLSPFARLKAIGFRETGRWRTIDGNTRYENLSLPASDNVLYAFVCDGDVMYIGKTVSSLRLRMKGYEKPGPSQTTNERVQAKIEESWNDGKDVIVFTLEDNKSFDVGEFHVNLATGLEDSLIEKLKPKWNFPFNKA